MTTRGVKTGLYMPNYGIFGDIHTLIQLAELAENHGWDGFFLWDHIAYKNDQGHTVNVADPWVALTAVALQTQTIRIGTTVTSLPRRRPWKLARETASLDQLSGGRLILGVGIGLGQSEWDDLGEETDLVKRGQMLDEGLDLLTGLWSGEPFSYDGQYYHIDDAQFLPRPQQQPRIPIWVGGFWPNKRPFQRMAQWDGMIPLFEDDSPQVFKEGVQYVQQQRTSSDAAFDIVKIGVSRPGMDLSSWVDAGMSWWLELLMPEVYGFQPGDEAARQVFIDLIKQGPPII